MCLKVIQLARGVIQEDNDLLDIWREQDKQAQRGQEASWSLTQKSADVYEDLLESVLFYYRENVGATEKGSTEDGDLRHS